MSELAGDSHTSHLDSNSEPLKNLVATLSDDMKTDDAFLWNNNNNNEFLYLWFFVFFFDHGEVERFEVSFV